MRRRDLLSRVGRKVKRQNPCTVVGVEEWRCLWIFGGNVPRPSRGRCCFGFFFENQVKRKGGPCKKLKKNYVCGIVDEKKSNK